MTNQQIFDRVLTHLRAQGEAAAEVTPAMYLDEEDHVSCKYRWTKPDGKVLMCAAGCLIPDDLYSRDLEGFGASSEEVRGVISASIGVSGDAYTPHFDLISKLQYAHDEYLARGGSLKDWEREMGDIAVRYKLTYIKPANYGPVRVTTA